MTNEPSLRKQLNDAILLIEQLLDVLEGKSDTITFDVVLPQRLVKRLVDAIKDGKWSGYTIR